MFGGVFGAGDELTECEVTVDHGDKLKIDPEVKRDLDSYCFDRHRLDVAMRMKSKLPGYSVARADSEFLKSQLNIHAKIFDLMYQWIFDACKNIKLYRESLSFAKGELGDMITELTNPTTELKRARDYFTFYKMQVRDLSNIANDRFNANPREMLNRWSETIVYMHDIEFGAKHAHSRLIELVLVLSKANSGLDPYVIERIFNLSYVGSRNQRLDSRYKIELIHRVRESMMRVGKLDIFI